MKNIRLMLAALCVLLATAAPAKAAAAGESREVLSLIERVNDYWQQHNTPYCRGFWDNAAYFTGNMEAYRLLGKAEWYAYSDKFCRHNQWKGAKSNDKRNWKYQWYGEGDDFVLFGDWQICFQTYIDMYNLVPADYKVARAKEVMGYECDSPDNKFWWWADALYMVMPVMTKMYHLTGEERYLDKLYENFLWSDSLMWDKDAQLYYRDGKYIWPKVTTSCDGGKSFWARGDGWVLAGLAKVLADMPRDYKNREIFVTRFCQLAEGVARCQRPDGYWSRSMLCEGDAPGPETSGTAFFCYGLLWGLNHGYLEGDLYTNAAEKAWKYLKNTALQPDGSIGYVQPIGEKPDPTRTVNEKSQAPFGTGAWLLAACERVRYLDRTTEGTVTHHKGSVRLGKGKRSFDVTVKNPTQDMRQDVVELDAKTVYEKLQIGGGRQFVVLDGDGVEQPYQIVESSCWGKRPFGSSARKFSKALESSRKESEQKILVQVHVRPLSESKLTFAVGEPRDYRLDCNGRIYPNREDDLTWENDRNAWRFYGPKMHQKGVTGYDLFTKNVSYPIQDVLYQSELTSYGINEQLKKQGRGGEWGSLHRDAYTYHRDRGQGMDAYTVGKTLGAGAPALMEGDQLLLPDVYEKAEILDNGPLRFTVRLTMYEQNGVREVRLISQDRGSHLAKCTVTYEGLTEKKDVCAGIVVHESNNTYIINKKEGYIAYADALDTPQGQNGQLHIACLFPEKMAKLRYVALPEKAAGGIGHVLGQRPLQPGETFTYWFGTGWSKYDVPNMQVWETLLQTHRRQLATPLIID